MKSRISRLGVVLLPVLALFASLAPPAHATQVGVIVIQGKANVGAGLSYPCFGPGTPTAPIDLAKCPPPIGTGNNPPPPNGTGVGVTFTGTGAGAVVKVQKLPKCASVCVEAGTFGITNATGRVYGQCGLSSGTLTGTVASTLSLGTKSNNRTFTVGFQGIGGVLVLSGTTSQNETLDGVVAALPDATTGGSCTNKDAKAFIIAGPIVVHRP